MKSVTWRIAGIAILGVVTYAFTKDVARTTGITLFFHSLRFALYYWHERLWDRTNWGRTAHPLADFRLRTDLTEQDRLAIRRFLEDGLYLLTQPKDRVAGVPAADTKQRPALPSRA